MNVPDCPICSHNKNKLLHRLDKGVLRICDTCRVVFFAPMPTQEELSDFYNDGYHDNFSQSTMAGSSFAENRYQYLEGLLATYSPSLVAQSERSLLDVGCGTGDFLQVAKRAGWTIAGTEISQGAVERAAIKLGNCIFEGDILSLNLPTASHDLITSYHVIEHLIDPVEKLRRCYQLLSPRGALFVETPNINSLGSRVRGPKWSHIIPPEHVVYFSPSSLEICAA